VTGSEDISMSHHGYQRTISPLLHREIPRWNARKKALRRAFDIILAFQGLAFLAPLLAMIALAIKLDDGGPVFYSQVRVGRGLQKFRVLKFRSMVPDPAYSSLLTAPKDARVTRVGRFLRKYKLDEMPQLVNVLRGEMRLVGVRPQVDRYVEMFRKEYEELLQAPPGITGLSTLRFRNEEQLFQEGSIETQYIEKILPRKLKLALEYERSRTFLSDLEILFRTVLSLASPSVKSNSKASEGALPALQKIFTNDVD
jgi:lipopolysaccharide/colanic/teichoic acid biosynthesis glycosyltransferase